MVQEPLYSLPMKTKKDLRIPFTWEERRPIHLERFFYVPKQCDVSGFERVRWDDVRVFGARAPVHVEFCSGNGEWIGRQAKERPDIHWVAIELRFDLARKIWLKSFREELPNLYVVCAEAALFTREFIEPRSVAKSYVHFPDPWPKLRHAKNRLIQAPFLASLANVTERGRGVTLVTDDLPYHQRMIDAFAAVSAWNRLPVQEVHSPADSFFARLWQSKGRSAHTLRYACE